MAVELSSGYVSATVRFDGVNRGISKLFDNVQKQAVSAGKRTGSAYAKALADEAKTAADQVKRSPKRSLSLATRKPTPQASSRWPLRS